jgi:catechol 2,3-dioxygenase-like lactoylglutathione lyase family enzyme
MTECEPQLVPELAVLDLTASLRFWCDLVGFDVSYARIEEGFAYLVLGRAHLMLDQIGVGRTWRTGELDAPLGRGVNLQVGIPSLEEPLQRLAAAQWPLFLEREEKWYRTGTEEAGVVQFLVQDPDGYLLRLQSSIGTRPAQD